MRYYHFYFIHFCTFFTGFVHLTEFSPEILSKNPKLEELDKKNITQYENLLVNIPVKAGQEIGTAWSFGLLGMVTVDLNRTNTGYLKPESYRGENWRIHSVSPFEYFESSLQRQILSKNPRQASPRGGKIDFDIDGKLVGNWFEVGTGGFRDLTKPPQQCGNFPCPYWEGHVALVYDYIDPGQLRVSIGHDWGLGISTPYGVKGNSPNFKEIGIADGMVKYKLVALKDMSRESGYISEDALIEVSDETRMLGTMLVEMLEPQKIKLEIFPGQTADKVGGFTNKAIIYQR